MPITISTQDPNTGERKVLALEYQGNHVLVPKPQTYESLERRTRDVFALGAAPDAPAQTSFYTTDLDICPGQRVMLHRDTWELIGSAVCVLHVEADEAPSTAGEARAEGEMMEEEEMVSRVLNEDEEEMDDEPAGADTPTAEHLPKNEPEPEPEPKPATTEPPPPRAPSPPAAAEDERARPKQESPSRRIAHEKPEGSQRVQPSSTARDADTHADGPSRKSRAESTRGVESLFDDPRFRLYSQSQSQPQSQPQPSQSQSQSQQSPRSQTTRALFPEDENRKLIITITHPPSHQTAPFKAKAQTKVAKVIAGVCKSFALDAATARLYMVVRADGDAEEHLFKCSREDTMAEAGAKDDARFIIAVQDESV